MKSVDIEDQAANIAKFVFDIAEGKWQDSELCQDKAKELCAAVVAAFVSQMTVGIEA